MKKFKTNSAIALCSIGLIGATAVAVPLLNATTITAHASELDVTLASKTSLNSTYNSPISTVGAHPGMMTVTNNIGAQANILLQTLKTAEIKIPAELVNNINVTGDSKISMNMGINITKIPLLGDLVNSLAIGADDAIKKQLAVLADSAALRGSNIDKVYDALNTLESFQNMDLSNQVSSVKITGDIATVKFDDSTARHIVNQLDYLLENLQTAINMVDWGNSLIGSVANTITTVVKPLLNVAIDGIQSALNSSANLISLIGNAGVFTTATINFPIDINVPMSWYEEHAPNGLTTTFTGAIGNSSAIGWDVFQGVAASNKNVTFSDIVAPKTPALTNVKSGSATVTAEAGSTVTIYDSVGSKLATAKVPGVTDGRAQGSVSISFASQKSSSKISAKATDIHGNTSASASAVTPKIPSTPTTPTKPISKTQVVYRVYNPNTGEHFYPTSAYERDMNIKAGWVNEGQLATAPTTGKAVYRVYNPNAAGGDHYYTMSNYEAKSLVSQGWKWDNNAKPVFYSGGNKKVYVAYNPNAKTGSHNYTTSSYEQNSLLSTGWKYGEVAWYAVK